MKVMMVYAWLMIMFLHGAKRSEHLFRGAGLT